MGCGPSAQQDARAAESQDESQKHPSVNKSKLQSDPESMGDVSGARDAWRDAAPRALRAPTRAARRLLTIFAARMAAGLNIVVRSASGVPAMDLRGHSDPYVIVEALGPAPDGAPAETTSRKNITLGGIADAPVLGGVV